MKRPLKTFFWKSDRGLSAMLVSLILTLFVGAPLVAMGVTGPFLFDAFFTLLILSGVVAFSDRRPRMIAVLSIVLATAAVRWASRWLPGATMEAWDGALSILALSILVALVLMQVFRPGPVTSYRIQGAVVVYLLLGLVWMQAYELLYRTIPGAFHFGSDDPSASRITHGLAYFSFTTLTTLGYGDITPAHPLARSLAMAEALIGQLYPAILIGRLVSLELVSRRERE